MNTEENNTQLPQSSVSVSVTELRVGNFISVGKNALHYQMDCEQIFEIEEIKKETVHFKGFFAGEFFKDLKPILLNEELFLKLGFKKHSTNPFWFRKKNLCISVLGKVELISWDMQIFKIDTTVEFLHTLQNFYSLLNCEELQDVSLTEH